MAEKVNRRRVYPKWSSVQRTEIISDDERGPDSVECSPTSHYKHETCLLDYSEIGFVCGCPCHDLEPGGSENG